jgi:hypothetical protein
MSLASFGRRAWHWFSNVSISFDLLGNALAGGTLRQTISKRAALARDRGRTWGCILCRLLEAIDPGHCDRAKEPNPQA